MPVFPLKGIEQARIDGILKELIGYCRLIEPLYHPIVEPVLCQGVYLIVIWVSGGNGRPYKAPKDVFAGKSSQYYYIRKFSCTLKASLNEEKKLFYISTDISFDDRPNLAADALEYIKNYIIKEVVLKEKNKVEAIRISNYPYAAVEEILSNAVYHRSYQINKPITVRITPEAIEITSFPQFDRSIFDEGIRNYEICVKLYRNRRIGDFLKELKLIEGIQDFLMW